MAYDPLPRGPFPVGVRTVTLSDADRGGRSLPTEIWYPATAANAGRDSDPKTRDSYELMPGAAMWQLAARDVDAREGAFPIVAFSHGFGAHRRQSTFLCTHLASHGYVVVAPDHTGNTVQEMLAAAMASASNAPRESPVALDDLLRDRPIDIRFVVDYVAREIPSARAERIAVAGHSFGGWTTLAVVSRDERVCAALPLAPAGGASSVTDVTALQAELDFEHGREVPTLFIVAQLDSILPLDSMHVLFDAVRSWKRMVVINNADHLHFCDAVERVHELFRMLPRVEGIPGGKPFPPIAELCPGEHGYVTIKSLGLAHLDAHVKGIQAATSWLDGAWRDVLTEHGVDYDVH